MQVDELDLAERRWRGGGSSGFAGGTLDGHRALDPRRIERAPAFRPYYVGRAGAR